MAQKRKYHLPLLLLLVLSLFTGQLFMITRRIENEANRRTAELDQIKSLAMYLKAHGIADSAKAKTLNLENLSSLIQEAANQNGIRLIDLIEHSRIPVSDDSPYELNQTQVILSGIKLESLCRFLHVLSDNNQNLTVERLQIKIGRQNDAQPTTISGDIGRHRADRETWDTNIAIRTTVLK